MGLSPQDESAWRNHIDSRVRGLERDFGKPVSRYGGGSVDRNTTVEVLSAVSGQAGRYNIKIYDGGILLDAAGNLSAADYGTPTADATNAVGWFAADIRTGTNSITTFPVQMEGVLAGMNSAAKVIVKLSGGGGSSLPTPIALYQHLMIVGYTSPTVYTLGWDFPRGY